MSAYSTTPLPDRSLMHAVAVSSAPPIAARNAPEDTFAAGGQGGWRGWVVPGLVLCGLLVLLYFRIAVKLAKDWYGIPDYSHGLLIPFFVAFLIWDKRKTLMHVRLRQSWAGVPVVALGLLVLLTGVFGADLFLSRFSFVILAAGIILGLFGKAMLKQLSFVLFVCVLGIPLPTLLLNHITFPLQLLASDVSARLLPLAGVPVLQEGNVMKLPEMSLEVAEACSGIRSLMSLFTVAVIYGYFMERSTKRRVVLALASIPIAVVANSARIFGTGLCVQYWDPEKAMGFFHEFSGWLIFLVSLACLYLVHTSMKMLGPKRGGAR